jgi:hypothetical protein
VHDSRICCRGDNYYCELGSGNCSGGPEVTPTEVTE